MGIGKELIRLDAVEKATGTAKYVEDLVPSNAFVVMVLHSTIANGIVKRMDIAKAQTSKGVELVVTCFDVPDRKYATAGHPSSLDPDHGDIKDKSILSRRVRYYGDDIAAVVADNRLNAQKALEKIIVEYETFQPLLTPETAVGNENVLHEEFPDNELARMDFEIQENGTVEFSPKHFSVDKCIDGCPDLETDHFYVPPQQHCHIENVACFAYMEGRRAVVVTPNQVPHTLRRNIAEAVNMPLGDVRVIKPYVGGGFGSKQDTMYEPLAVYLSKMLGGRCVAVCLSREETFVNSRTRHAMDMFSALKVDDTGKIVKKALRLHSNGGAYAGHGHAVSAYAVTNFFQIYPGGSVQIGESSTSCTNLPVAAAMRGYGIPQLAFALESQMDDIARRHGWDPVEFRKKNMMRKGFYDPFDRFCCESNGLEACIDRGMEQIGWHEKKAAYRQFNKGGGPVKKGVGMAIFAYKTGVYPINVETGSCRMVLNEDGSLQIQIGATELGQGSDTVFAQMASEITTIPEDKIHVVSSQDTDISPHDCGAYASRQSYISGGAVKKTAWELYRRIVERAADLAEAEKDNLEIKQEGIYDKRTGNHLFSIGHVARYVQYANDRKTETEHITAEATYTGKNNAFAFGAGFADVEVDVPVGKIKIKKFVSVHDSGTILNPALARGQVYGGVAMGVGYALGEQMLFDKETGRPLNNNFLDYKIPTSMDIPEIVVDFVETYEPSGPFGNKALGEPPMIPVAPAIRNALLDATGVSIYELPMNPQKLVHAFMEAGLI